VRHFDWRAWAFWLLVVVMLAAAVLISAVLMIGDARLHGAGGTESAPAAGRS